MGSTAVRFLAVVLTALVLVPAGAHLISLPNKIGLGQDPYFVTQGVYRGWALSGIVIAAALVATLALTIAQRGRGASFWLAGLAFVCIAATLVIFFLWTFPANQATQNWTVPPPNWLELRTQWEYSHAVNAVLIFVALCSVTLSALAARE